MGATPVGRLRSPRARLAARPTAVRSLIASCSHCATTARTPSKPEFRMRPEANKP